MKMYANVRVQLRTYLAIQGVHDTCTQMTEHSKRMLKFKYPFQKYEIVYAL